ncbi:hypothetical protein SORBI_3001G411800 [Sorghum bicolor]|uniref:Uncharacterized protein n=1 Tax=Sorghum bicolor TaxID=4558 RepID=A0A1B6QP02_SORBI|nr:hypothetical protein SORBI_3001G411800 [Sorghum bicolor]
MLGLPEHHKNVLKSAAMFSREDSAGIYHEVLEEVYLVSY